MHVCRTFSACDTSLRPKPKLAHSSASPEMTFAPASTTLENSDTANKVLVLAPRSGERVARALSAVTRVFDALWRGPGEGQYRNAKFSCEYSRLAADERRTKAG